MIYEIIQLDNESYKCRLMIQDGVESWTCKTLAEAASTMIYNAKYYNGTTITKNDITIKSAISAGLQKTINEQAFESLFPDYLKDISTQDNPQELQELVDKAMNGKLVWSNDEYDKILEQKGETLTETLTEIGKLTLTFESFYKGAKRHLDFE